MDFKSLRNSMLLITYTGILLLLVLRFQEVMALFTQVMGVFSPFIAGFATAFVLTPLCVVFTKWTRKLFPKMKESGVNGIAVGMTYLFMFMMAFGLVSVVIPKLVDSVSIFVDSLKVYTENLQNWLTSLTKESDSEILSEVSVDLAGLFNYLSTYLEQMLKSALSTMSVAASQVMVLTGGVFSMIVNGVIALIFSVYMLADRVKLRRQCRRVLYAYTPKKFADSVSFVLGMAADTFSKFVAGQLLEACILGGLCALGMLFIQAEYALLIGIIVGLSSMVPVAGAYVGGGFCFILLFMVSPMDSLVFVIFLVILQQFEGNVIYPRVVGSSIGLPGLWVVFGVIIGGGLFGLLGVLLSVPSLSVVYALFRMDVQRREEKKRL